MDATELRRTYAEKIRDLAGTHSAALTRAFAAVPRERFLGPRPWRLLHPGPKLGYQEAPDARLEHIYDDVLVAIDPARHLNNGQPSAHAKWIEAAGPQPGQSVLHIGCGTGYYTAILAELVGPAGRVVAVEIDSGLAERARACLAPWPQVRVETGDGSRPQGPHDVIYVNAGATHARREWLAALLPGGRLLLPLTAHLLPPLATHKPRRSSASSCGPRRRRACVSCRSSRTPRARAACCTPKDSACRIDYLWPPPWPPPKLPRPPKPPRPPQLLPAGTGLAGR